ncbi:MAG: hypothetical protein AAF934_01155 [Bacteroidota bacterium]
MIFRIAVRMQEYAMPPALGIAADTPQPRLWRGEEYERKARPYPDPSLWFSGSYRDYRGKGTPKKEFFSRGYFFLK